MLSRASIGLILPTVTTLPSVPVLSALTSDDTGPWAVLITAVTPLLLGIGAGVWKLWERLSRPVPTLPALVPQGQPVMPAETPLEQERARTIAGLREELHETEVRLSRVEAERATYRERLARAGLLDPPTEET